MTQKRQLALSVRQPWAWLIVNGHKDIENRDWSTSFRGRILVHASKGMTEEEYYDCRAYALAINPDIPFPKFAELERGGFVGAVDVTGCVKKTESPWFIGEYGFTLENPEVLPFQQYRGQLNFFEVKGGLCG